MLKKKVKGIIVLLLAISLTFILSKPWKINENPIPALGNLLNPFSGIWQNTDNTAPSISLNSDQISGKVEIIFDERMVPHIYADNMQDALYAQGYVEAYHRLFQMDISTRSPDGRLSEFFGEKLLERDKTQRRIGLGFAADNAIEGWASFPDELKLVQSYSAGVNHYIKQLKPKNYPIEYKLKNSKPSAWSVRHCALLLKAMSQTLAGYEEDIEMSNALLFLGQEKFNKIYPEYNPKDIPVIQEQHYSNDSLQALLPRKQDPINKAYSRIERPRSPEGVGSNNWAVNGSKTKSGDPILCNDPHLGLGLPSVWYEIAISTPEFSAQGVTLLGMPGIMIGFNQNIAWGETNVGHDVMDYHEIKWLDEAKKTYELNNEVHQIEVKIEEFKLPNGQTVFDTVSYTKWGPVVEPNGDLALRWLAHEKPTTPDFLTFINGMTCSNYDDYLKATENFICPAQNFIYADNHGEIGLRVNGQLPLRDKHQGRTISQGEFSSNGWTSYLKRNQNPQERNPSKNYVSSANQWSTDESFPYYYTGNFAAYRGRIINEKLADASEITVEDMMALQQNTESLFAKETLPYLIHFLDSKFHQDPNIVALTNWNYNYGANNIETAFFEAWFSHFKSLLFDELESTDQAIPAPKKWVAAQFLTSDTLDVLIDMQETKQKETIQQLVTMAYQKALSSADNKAWGDYRPTVINHLMQIPAFSAGELHLGGNANTVNAIQTNFGPSWRMIVELKENPVAYVTYPGGQSGNPASNYYTNRIEQWATGKYDKVTLKARPEEIQNPLQKITIDPR